MGGKGIRKMMVAITLTLTCIMSNMPKQIYADTTQPVMSLSNDFEDGQVGGWQARGIPKVEVVTNPSDATKKSLAIKGRTKGWNSAQIDITDKIEVDKEYIYSLKVYQASTTAQTIKITNQLKVPDVAKPGEFKNDYKQIASVENIAQNTWTEIKGNLVVPTGCTSVIFYPESANETLEFFIDDVSIMPVVPAEIKIPEIDWTIPSVYETYKDDFTVGVAVPTGVIRDTDKSSWVLKHFNSFTAENNMKPDSILDKAASQTSGALKLNFDKSDEYYEYAKTNQIPLRGHTLVWHSQTPDWFFKVGFKDDGALVTREIMLARMESYIQQVVTRYIDKDKEAGLTKPTIYAWDVVNEAIDAAQPNGMRDSLWRQTIGADFVEKAFEYTRKYTVNKYTQGKVELFYNDYSTENTDRRQAILNLVTPIAQKGLIDGVGLQSHHNLTSPSTAEIEKSIKSVGALGLKVHITELDTNVYTNDNDKLDAFPEDLSIKQAYRYKELFDLFVKNKDIVTNVTIWGLTDDASWLNGYPVKRNNWPLLFDKYLQPKLAYWAIVDMNKVPVLIQEIKSYEGSITVDGEEDLAWKTQVSTPMSKSSDFASFKTVWQEERLYVWIDVKDTNVNAEDGVVLYISPANNKQDTANAEDKKIVILRNGKVEGTNVEAKINPMATGYTVEAMIPLGVTKAQGEKIGFDLARIDGINTDRWNDLSKGDAIPSKYGELLLNAGIKQTQAVNGTPIVDGLVDEVWKKANEISTDIYTQNTQGAKAKAKTLWDKDFLYVLVEVTDGKLSDKNKNAWEQDSVEVFIDENLHKTASYEPDDVQYRVNYKNTVSINGGSKDTKFKSAVTIIEGGYRIEMSIPYSISEFKTGQVMGFDLQINDDDGSGARTSMSNWYDKTGAGWGNTQGFGVISLGE